MNNKLIWPESLTKVTYTCSVCNNLIDCEENMKYIGTQLAKYYTPASRYWNVAHNQVYCNPSHMMDAHLKEYNL